MPPLVSVIIPAYNTEAYIAQAIASALGQTLQHLEVIVVDDASTDGTVAVVQQFHDDRLTLLINSENIGAAGARNRALEVATGEWIAVLDSDDWYAPERLATLLAIARDYQADLIADDLYFVAAGDNTPSSTLIQSSGTPVTEVSSIAATEFVKTDVYGQPGLHLGLSKPLMRRAFLQQHNIRYDLALRMGQDFWLYLNCLIQGARYILVPRPYYYYRFRPGSLVLQSKVQRLNGYCDAARQFLQRPEVQCHPPLRDALQHNLTVFERNRAYYRVVEPLKQKRIPTALGAMVRNPYFFIHFAGQLRAIVQRRWQYYIKGDRLAYETRLSNR